MSITREEAEKIASAYIGTELSFKERGLGDGKDGCVFSTPQATALKVFKYPELFERELAVYRRLHEMNVTEVAGFAVPSLVGASDEYLVIEMTMVQPPFLLDFAGSTLDEPPDFTDEIMNERWETWTEIFGERIEVVREVAIELEARYGIFYGDFSRNNLKFEGDP